MKAVFDELYRTKAWGEGSGPGSTPDSLNFYKRILETTIGGWRVKSVADLGCGFFTPYADVDWQGASYVGIDVAIKCFETNPVSEKRTFLMTDFLEFEPRTRLDLAICKDVLQHWCEADVLRGLKYLNQFPLALITNSVVCGHYKVNSKIPTGGFRPLNLLQPPYSLKPIASWCYTAVQDPPDVKMVLLCKNSP